MRRLLLAALLLLPACSAGTDEPTPTPSADGVEQFEDLSTEHVEGRVEYEQTPPAGGEHNGRWLACGVYDEEVPPETAVHSMEHGAVWVTHRPDLPAADVAQLAELTAVDEEYVLVTPYEGLPSPVVASAWGLQLQVDAPGDPRLEQFVRQYAGGGRGGEPGAPCRGSGLTLEQARAAVGE